MKTFIKCECGYEEEFNKSLLAKIIGGAMVGGGFWAWTAYIFAGTGFAMPICIAIAVGGLGVMAYADTISKWISGKYSCPICGKNKWHMVKK
ncbi:MAG: hypothetical protein Q4E42_05075 [Phascolarctobacterium sp.]|nr:hypothetical protein [Phascolarctobacterium sp.]